MNQSQLRRTLFPFNDSLDRLELILGIVDAHNLLWSQNYEGMQKRCDQIKSSEKWKLATDAIKIFRHNVRGLAALRLLGQSETVDDYTEVLKLEPTNVLASSFQGDRYRTNGKLEEAEPLLANVVLYDPDVAAEDYCRLANVQQRLGKNDEAYASYKAALERSSHDLVALQNLVAMSLKSKNYSDVVECTTKLLSLDPKNGNVYLQRGSAYAALHEDEKAVADYTSATENGQAAKGNIYQARAGLNVRLGKFDAALDDCDLVLKYEPDNLKARLYKALIYKDLGRLDEAVKTQQEAVNFAKSTADIAQAHGNFSMIYFRAGDGEAAIRECDMALAIEPNNILALNNRAFAAAHLGRAEDGLPNIDAAFVHAPQVTPNLHSTRGVVLYMLKRYDEAAREFDTALETDQKNGEAFYFRSKIFEQMGESEKAAEYALRAEALNYAHPSFSVLNGSVK